jgi:hypothetical protein
MVHATPPIDSPSSAPLPPAPAACAWGVSIKLKAGGGVRVV